MLAIVQGRAGGDVCHLFSSVNPAGPMLLVDTFAHIVEEVYAEVFMLPGRAHRRPLLAPAACVTAGFLQAVMMAMDDCISAGINGRLTMEEASRVGSWAFWILNQSFEPTLPLHRCPFARWWIVRPRTRACLIG